MKVLLIHEHGRPHGSGGVISTFRLHCALREAGIESTLACRRRGTDRVDVIELPRSDRLENWLGKISWRLGLNDVHCVSTFKLTRFKPLLEADLVNIHGWHTNFFNYLAVPRISRIKPIVASLHDMWNLTGHCATSLDCERWKTGCGKCPYPKVFPPIGRDATAIDWKLKNWAYRRSDMFVTTPSKWLEGLVGESMLGRFPIRTITNGVDVEIFTPRDQRETRRGLGIPEDALVVLFSAAVLSNRLKGPDLLIEALSNLPANLKSQIVVLLMGDKGHELTAQLDVPAIDFGFVEGDAAKAQCYAAADVVALPTRADVLARVLLEAQSCGTPCVASNVGGVGELVETGTRGYLARAGDAEDLREGLIHILEDEDRRTRYRANCRQFILDNHTFKHLVDGFVSVFNEAVQRRQ